MNLTDRERLDVIKRRWTKEHKISTPDVDFLVECAEKRLAMIAARDTHLSGMGRLFDGLFGDGR